MGTGCHQPVPAPTLFWGCSAPSSPPRAPHRAPPKVWGAPVPPDSPPRGSHGKGRLTASHSHHQKGWGGLSSPHIPQRDLQLPLVLTKWTAGDFSCPLIPPKRDPQLPHYPPSKGHSAPLLIPPPNAARGTPAASFSPPKRLGGGGPSVPPSSPKGTFSSPFSQPKGLGAPQLPLHQRDPQLPLIPPPKGPKWTPVPFFSPSKSWGALSFPLTPQKGLSAPPL